MFTFPSPACLLEEYVVTKQQVDFGLYGLAIGMPNISDLPLEILELVFSHPFSTPPERDLTSLPLQQRPEDGRPFLGTITGAPLRLTGLSRLGRRVI
jgi:hypothetical protein